MDGLQPAMIMARAGDQLTIAGPSQCPIVMRFFFSLFILVLSACGSGHAAVADSAHSDSVALARQDSINRAQPGYIVDSILPMDEQLRRFRTGISDTVRVLDGAPSRDALVRSFARSLESADTIALTRLTISRAEFAWLVYPASPLSAPPYQQPIDISWLRHAAASSSGLARLLNRLGGRPFQLESWRCANQPVIEGSNRIWGDCVVTFAVGGAERTTLGLFSSIIEREGRFKILSYANAF
jgi:hypothetical protein